MEKHAAGKLSREASVKQKVNEEVEQIFVVYSRYLRFLLALSWTNV